MNTHEHQLPTLPAPDGAVEIDHGPAPGGGREVTFGDAWSEPLVREYARAAIASSAASQGEPDGWISVHDRMPEPGAECLVWIVRNPFAKEPYVFIDTWDVLREDPIGMGGPTIETGLGWGDNEFEDISHWMPLPGAPSASERQQGGECPHTGQCHPGHCPCRMPAPAATRAGEAKHVPLPYTTPMALWKAFRDGAEFVLHYHGETYEVTRMEPREKVVYVQPPRMPVKVYPDGQNCESAGDSIWLEQIAAQPPQAPPAAPSAEQGEALDIEFRLRIARLLAELHGEETLSEQQCARYMGIDLVSWRRIEHTFSAGTWLPEGSPGELLQDNAGLILREALGLSTQPAAPVVRKSLSASVADALRPFLSPGQKVIWREPFRWFDDNGVLSNHYDGMDAPYLAKEFGYEVIEDCGCAAVIAAAPKTGGANG